MHYLPDGHRAETRAESDLRPGLKAAAVDQPTVGEAPAVIVVAAVPSRLSQDDLLVAEAVGPMDGRSALMLTGRMECSAERGLSGSFVRLHLDRACTPAFS